MRTIKFRGKRRTNGQWVYGSLVSSQDLNAAIYFQTGNGSVKIMDWVYVQPETIGQFTGLFDKNGREIYEGDIIRHSPKSDIYYIIEWHDCGLVAKQIGSSSYAGITYWINTTEVIGNIYDNPELAKGGSR